MLLKSIKFFLIEKNEKKIFYSKLVLAE